MGVLDVHPPAPSVLDAPDYAQAGRTTALSEYMRKVAQEPAKLPAPPPYAATLLLDGMDGFGDSKNPSVMSQHDTAPSPYLQEKLPSECLYAKFKARSQLLRPEIMAHIPASGGRNQASTLVDTRGLANAHLDRPETVLELFYKMKLPLPRGVTPVVLKAAVEEQQIDQLECLGRWLHTWENDAIADNELARALDFVGFPALDVERAINDASMNEPATDSGRAVRAWRLHHRNDALDLLVQWIYKLRKLRGLVANGSRSLVEALRSLDYPAVLINYTMKNRGGSSSSSSSGRSSSSSSSSGSSRSQGLNTLDACIDFIEKKNRLYLKVLQRKGVAKRNLSEAEFEKLMAEAEMKEQRGEPSFFGFAKSKAKSRGDGFSNVREKQRAANERAVSDDRQRREEEQMKELEERIVAARLKEEGREFAHLQSQSGSHLTAMQTSHLLATDEIDPYNDTFKQRQRRASQASADRGDVTILQRADYQARHGKQQQEDPAPHLADRTYEGDKLMSASLEPSLLAAQPESSLVPGINGTHLVYISPSIHLRESKEERKLRLAREEEMHEIEFARERAEAEALRLRKEQRRNLRKAAQAAALQKEREEREALVERQRAEHDMYLRNATEAERQAEKQRRIAEDRERAQNEKDDLEARQEAERQAKYKREKAERERKEAEEDAWRKEQQARREAAEEEERRRKAEERARKQAIAAKKQEEAERAKKQEEERKRLEMEQQRRAAEEQSRRLQEQQEQEERDRRMAEQLAARLNAQQQQGAAQAQPQRVVPNQMMQQQMMMKQQIFMAQRYGMPMEWAFDFDPNSGRIFFKNHITKQTQWEDPRPLPQGVQRLVDPRTGQPYFTNHIIKQTSWKDPRPRLPANAQELAGIMSRLQF